MKYIESLSATDLSLQCAHSRPGKLYEMYCFELFRRAIIKRQQECWTIVFTQYQRLVYQWVKDAAQGYPDLGNNSYEEMVIDTFTAFWRSYDAEKLDRADGLGSILRYLKSCAGTSVLQAIRKIKAKKRFADLNTQSVGSERSPENFVVNPPDNLSKQEDVDKIWLIVDSCCHDEKDRIVAWYSFVWGEKPAQILIESNGIFADVEEIGNIRRKLKNRLSRNKELQAAWE